jgi:hypothetical protein
VYIGPGWIPIFCFQARDAIPAISEQFLSKLPCTGSLTSTVVPNAPIPFQLGSVHAIVTIPLIEYFNPYIINVMGEMWIQIFI